MIIHLLDKNGKPRHEFDVTGDLQTLQQPSSASTAVILHKNRHYVFSYTNAGGGAITFVEAELVEITTRIGSHD